MRLGIDISFILKDFRGMGRLVRGFIKAFLNYPGAPELFLISSKNIKLLLLKEIFLKENWNFILADEIRKVNLDLIWFPWSRIDFSYCSNLKKIVNIYDLTPFIFNSGGFISKLNNYKDRKRFKKIAYISDKIITFSKNSKSDLQNYLNIQAEKIKVIYPGIDAQFHPLNFSSEKKAFLLKKYSQEGAPFIFWIGTIEKRKNIIGLINAFKILKEEEKIPHKLILAGAVYNNKDELRIIKKLKLEYEIIFLENINDLELLELYNLADLFIFPSFYEGFGLPVLEAFACGTPAALADSSSLPEVAKDAALYFNPEDTYEIARVCAKILKDKSIQEKLRNLAFKRILDFSWRKSVNELLVFFKTLL